MTSYIKLFEIVLGLCFDSRSVVVMVTRGGPTSRTIPVSRSSTSRSVPCTRRETFSRCRTSFSPEDTRCVRSRAFRKRFYLTRSFEKFYLTSSALGASSRDRRTAPARLLPGSHARPESPLDGAQCQVSGLALTNDSIRQLTLFDRDSSRAGSRRWSVSLRATSISRKSRSPETSQLMPCLEKVRSRLRFVVSLHSRMTHVLCQFLFALTLKRAFAQSHLQITRS